jgi:hypothetical protein
MAKDKTYHAEFPLPLAKLSKPVDGQSYLVNATCLWHLLPSESMASTFFKVQAPSWRLADRVGAKEGAHLLPGNRGKAWRQTKPDSSDGVDGQEEGGGTVSDMLKFKDYMSTARLTLCALVWIAAVKKQPEDLQRAVLAVFQFLVLAGGATSLFGLAITRGDALLNMPIVHGEELRAWLVEHMARGAWSKAASATVPISSYSSDSVPAVHVAWFVARYYAQLGEAGGGIGRLCRLLDEMEAMFTHVMVDRHTTTMPPVSLPDVFSARRQGLAIRRSW